MSIKGKRVIWVGPADGSNSKPLNVEGIATEAVPPGSVVDFAAASAGLELADDAATVFGKILMVADKDQQRSKSVDDAWTVDENMVAIQPRSGEFVNVLVITGQAVLKGLPLSRSATPGALELAATDGTDEIEIYADEAVTTAATQLVRCRMA
jgi:hypothetical protein